MVDTVEIAFRPEFHARGFIEDRGALAALGPFEANDGAVLVPEGERGGSLREGDGEVVGPSGPEGSRALVYEPGAEVASEDEGDLTGNFDVVPGRKEGSRRHVDRVTDGTTPLPGLVSRARGVGHVEWVVSRQWSCLVWRRPWLTRLTPAETPADTAPCAALTASARTMAA